MSRPPAIRRSFLTLSPLIAPFPSPPEVVIVTRLGLGARPPWRPRRPLFM